jgi:hypothetical protein
MITQATRRAQNSKQSNPLGAESFPIISLSSLGFSKTSSHHRASLLYHYNSGSKV